MMQLERDVLGSMRDGWYENAAMLESRMNEARAAKRVSLCLAFVMFVCAVAAYALGLTYDAVSLLALAVLMLAGHGLLRRREKHSRSQMFLARVHALELIAQMRSLEADQGRSP